MQNEGESRNEAVISDKGHRLESFLNASVREEGGNRLELITA